MEFMIPLIHYIYLDITEIYETKIITQSNFIAVSLLHVAANQIKLFYRKSELHYIKKLPKPVQLMFKYFYFNNRTYSIKSKSASVCSFCHHQFQNKPANSCNSL